MQTYKEFKNEQWEHDFRTHPVFSPLEGVLIETRPDPDLRSTLANFSCHLPYTALTILGSKKNFNLLNQIIGPNTNVRILELTLEPPFTIAKFNDLLVTPQFWDQFHGDRVLFFMTDTGIRKNDVLRFLKYDWIGAPWHHFPVGDPRVFQGNGALSIRNPKLLKIFCTKFSRGELNEDVFFSACMALGCPGATLPTRSEAIKFSMEGTDYPDTMGFHNTQSYREQSIAWSGYEGPSRRLVTITKATADGHDVTTLIRLGIGAKCLRIGRGALIYKGTKKLAIDGTEWELEDGYVKDEIIIMPNEGYREPNNNPESI